MFANILIATDGSKRSDAAVKQGIRFAKSLGAHVTALHVIPPFHQFTFRSQMLLSYHTALAEDSEAAYAKATKAQAEKILHAVARVAAASRVRCTTVHVSDDQPYKAILATAKKKRCDLILMASHGFGGLGGVLLGSETQKVLTHSSIPVLVYR